MHSSRPARALHFATRPKSLARLALLLAASLVLAAGAGCGDGSGSTSSGAEKGKKAGQAEKQALVLALAQFAPKTAPGGAPEPLPAGLEFLVEQDDGSWKLHTLADPDSNVFHKAMAYTTTDGSLKLLTAGGTQAVLKLWSPGADGALVAEDIWRKDFGGKFSRMRDVEIADLFGDGTPSMAVATHDQGVVASVRPEAAGGYAVTEIDQEADTFVHEIEVGDLDGDGVLEVYATPSEPNRLDGTPQSGHVVRYVPKSGEGRVVVADLGDRHAKEILVADVDGDGRDELYVAVEGNVHPTTSSLEQQVEIRRYDADTDPTQGVVIAEIRDRLCRFLTAGDVDGDGKQELVAAAFQSGLWLLRPDASQPRGGKWQVTSIDRDSGGFEHAAILADLDADGRDELYVASDKHNEVRRYMWDGQRLARKVIYKRAAGGGVFTWNVMPIPRSLVPGS
jgi:hypothetical protein